MRNPRGERNILVVHQMECQSGNLKLRGIFAAAKRRGYTVRFVPSNTIGLPIDDYIRLWSPLGLITGDSEYVPSRQNDKVLPTVYLDTDRRRRRQGVRVASDQEKLARSAFDALSAFGYGNYAYVPYCLDSAAGEAYWSLERHRAFARMVRRDVGKCVRLAPSYCQNGDRQVLLEAFRAWLDRVAKPCAVFAANDKAADYLVSMCSLCGVSVPDEIAVIGVDNNPLVCDNAPTPIASVEPDFRRCGELSVELLDEMIGGGKPAAENLVTSLRVVVRASAAVAEKGDRLVAAALEFIRGQSGLNIGTADVAERLRVSRRWLEVVFRRTTGRSVHDEIVRAKIERVKDLLLNTDDTLADIARAVGYSSGAFLASRFRREVGCAPEVWRTSAQGPR